MRHFTDAELEGLLGLEEVVEVMRRAFLAFDEDGARSLEQPKGFYLRARFTEGLLRRHLLGT